MGVMIGGVFHVDDPGPDTTEGGTYKRAAANIRHDLPPGPWREGRFHLYAAWNCPWAHRVLLVRALKGLERVITVAYARPRRSDQGWIYDEDGDHQDGLFGIHGLHEAYARAPDPYTGRVTVPLLWDRDTNRPVSNESADLVRGFGNLGQGPDLYPADLAGEIDRWNDLIYPKLNNGVYRAGFARTQEAYEAGYHDVFDALSQIEARLGDARYLCGARFTEADLRLFPTLARFDVAYHGAFKCNKRRIIDYPNLWAYAREIYQMPGVASTVRFEIYKQGYYSPSPQRNPLGIVPLGPDIDWTVPHGRDAR